LYAELRRWYESEKDRYDFRRERNPYRTWITEIFLQQTQIAAGREKLKIFLKQFPDVVALARARVEDVLAAFQGMGYYSRARNMHRAAKYIVENFKGSVPTAYADLRKITGIGHYTAAIVASIHANEKILALDANHARVLSRFYAIGHAQGSRKFKETAEIATRPLFEAGMSAGDVNESLMQWGQLICKKTPLCERCFAREYCKAYAENSQRDYPRKAPRAEALELLWVMLVHRRGEKYQLIENNSKFPFLKGEWMFPSLVALPDELKTLPAKIEARSIKSILAQAHGLPTDFKHAITRYKISVKLLIAQDPQGDGKYFTVREMNKICHSSLMQKALKRLDKLEFQV